MEAFTSIFSWVTNHIPELLEVVGGFAIIATMTKNKSDDKIIQMILDGINFLGGNLGKSKNADS